MDPGSVEAIGAPGCACANVADGIARAASASSSGGVPWPPGPAFVEAGIGTMDPLPPVAGSDVRAVGDDAAVAAAAPAVWALSVVGCSA